MAKKSFILGTAIRLTSVISIPTATTATIKIVDPDDAVKVALGTMTKEADGVYTYIYQSIATDTAGDYIATISITDAENHTAVVQDTFTLEEQE